MTGPSQSRCVLNSKDCVSMFCLSIIIISTINYQRPKYQILYTYYTIRSIPNFDSCEQGLETVTKFLVPFSSNLSLFVPP